MQRSDAEDFECTSLRSCTGGKTTTDPDPAKFAWLARSLKKLSDRPHTLVAPSFIDGISRPCLQPSARCKQLRKFNVQNLQARRMRTARLDGQCDTPKR